MRDVPHLVTLLINMVPYHHARWNAFAGLGDFRCTALELSGRDEFSILEQGAGTASHYQKRTLFREASSQEVPHEKITGVLEGALAELRPDVLCVSGYSFIASLAALRWASRHSVPAVICSESNRFDADRNPVREWIKRKAVGFGSAGMAGGTPQADYLVELGLPREAVFAGYDAVDNDHFATGAEAARRRDAGQRKELGLPARYFMACSRFGAKKNIPGLIEAFALYRNQKATDPDSWDLVIIGEGELRSEIEQAVRDFGVTGTVHLAGARPYSLLPAYYGLAGAFIHASTTEQWGLVVNEAMASGLPVLVSNRCGCATDLVQDGRNGFTFDPANTGDLAQLMVEISAPGFSLSDFGATSRQIIAQWGPDRFALGMKNAANHALEAGTRRGSLVDRLVLDALIRRQ